MATKRRKGGIGQAVLLQTVLGHVVADRRRQLQMSQRQLASLLEMVPASASKIEAGQVVSLDLLWRLARALGWQPSELIVEVERAVHRLESNGVRVLMRREPVVRSEASGDLLTTAALAGVLGFLLASERR